MRDAKVDKQIFWPAMIAVVAAIIPLAVDPEGSGKFLKTLFNFTTNQLGFSYIWFGIGAFMLLLWFGWGKYGKVRMGGDEAKPEFSKLSWIAMLFCSGVGTSLLYWSTIEWVYYYQSPPFGIAAETTMAADWAAMYGMYHWGPIGWAIYCLPALPIGYAFHNKKIPLLRLSQACRGVIGDRADGALGKFIDIMFIFGLIGGTGTSLGLGTPILSESISTLFGVERTFGLDMAVVVVWTGLFACSVYLGLEKGIKRLSDVNVWLGFLLCAIIFVLGPTVFMLDTFTQSVGLMIDNFFRMSFYTDPIAKSKFPQWWTIFYWAWWVAYAPFMGLFIARISKGRTFREIITANIVWGSSGCWLFFALFGNLALYDQLNDIVPVMQIMKDVSPQAAIVAVVNALPMGPLVLVIFLAMSFIYSATTVDSSAYTIASVTSKGFVAGETEPSRNNRLFWALALGGIALGLMNLGGLKPLQTASLVVALPLMVIIGVSIWSLLRWLKEDVDGVVEIAEAKPEEVAEKAPLMGMGTPD